MTNSNFQSYLTVGQGHKLIVVSTPPPPAVLWHEKCYTLKEEIFAAI